MLVLSTQARVFAATCYLIAPRSGGPCLVLDPGVGVSARVADLVDAHGLTPVAVAATHGHPDHLWDAADLCERWGVPFLLGAGDLDRLADPAAALGPGMAEAFVAMAGGAWRLPGNARALPDDGVLDLAGEARLRLLPAPGHTPGSTVVVADGAPDPASVVPAGVTGRALPPTSTLAFTGDVLFAGSIGRMDLPGGDEDAMIRTLASLVAVLPRDAWVLPGHGPSSTMSGEAARNPYLSAAFLDARRSAPGTY